MFMEDFADGAEITSVSSSEVCDEPDSIACVPI